MKLAYIGFAAAALLVSGVSSADELLLTGANNAKSNATSIALDVVSDGDTRGFDFVIPVAKGAKVDTSKCLSGLPKGFQGTCQFNGEEITGFVFAWEKISLDAGIHSIGSVTVSSNAVSDKVAAKFSAADSEGREIASAAKSNFERPTGGKQPAASQVK